LTAPRTTCRRALDTAFIAATATATATAIAIVTTVAVFTVVVVVVVIAVVDVASERFTHSMPFRRRQRLAMKVFQTIV
jgi:hypothetical protein